MPAKRTRAEKPEAQRGKRAKVTRQPKLSSDAAKGGRRKATSDQGGKGAGVGGSGAAAARGGAGGGDAAVDVSVAAVKAALPGLLKALSALTDTYLVPFPEEVAALSAAARALQPDDPCRAFEAATGLVLTGPFDALEGALPEGDSTAAILHYRYFHDPPEINTVARFADSNVRHLAYYRDEPTQMPLAVVESDADSGATFSAAGDSLCAALRRIADASDDDAKHAAVAAIDAAATAVGVDVDARGAWSARSRNIVAKTISKLGIIVPYDKKTESGYRPTGYTPAQFLSLLRGVDREATSGKEGPNSIDYATLRTNCSLANDEGDPGMSLEVGLGLWAGPPCAMLQKQARRTLSVAYMLLDRDAFATVIQEHARERIDSRTAEGGATALSRAAAQ